MTRGPVSQYIEHHFRHFNAAALMDAAKGWERHLDEGGKMPVTLAGAMSTAELGLSLAELIRRLEFDRDAITNLLAFLNEPDAETGITMRDQAMAARHAGCNVKVGMVIEEPTAIEEQAKAIGIEIVPA